MERAGERPPLRSVAPSGSFLLIAGEQGQEWCTAVEKAAADRGSTWSPSGSATFEGDWLDPRLAFVRVREVGPDGAILVRPDRVIAWRSISGSPAVEAEVAAALDQVLARGA